MSRWPPWGWLRGLGRLLGRPGLHGSADQVSPPTATSAEHSWASRQRPAATAAPEQRRRRREQLTGTRRWCAVFGPMDDGDLDGFDLVVVGEPAPGSGAVLSAGQISALRERTVLLLGHVRLGPGGGSEALHDRVRDWLRADLDGVYLDEVQAVSASEAAAVVDSVRRAAPELLVVAQGGASVQPALDVDAVGPARPLLEGHVHGREAVELSKPLEVPPAARRSSRRGHGRPWSH